MTKVFHLLKSYCTSKLIYKHILFMTNHKYILTVQSIEYLEKLICSCRVKGAVKYLIQY